MKKKTLAMTVLSIIIVSVVILAAGIRSALQPESKDFMQFSNTVTVTDSGVEHEIAPIHFEPIGKKVTFDVEIDGPDGIDTEVIIQVGSPDSASIVKEKITGTGNGNAKIHVTDAEGKDLYMQFIPENSGSLAPSSYSLQFKLKATSDELKFHSGPMMLAALLLVFGIYVIVTTNRSESKYDERQLAARGKAAMNALIIVMMCCFTYGCLSMSVENFPISMYEVGIGSVIVGSTAFAIMCDVNDAFFGLSEKRAKFIALSWVMGILALFGAGMTFLGVGKFNEITGTGLVVGICFFLLAIELTVKSSIEKKEAADEES
jgi:hypothetical protein